MNKNAYDFFLSISKDVAHSNSTYLDHCQNIYNILKDIGADEEVCLAGLYHSVYGTEYFNLGQVFNRDVIKELIGSRAEELVHIFCELRNRHYVILTNSFNFSKQVHYDLACIEYANLKEQAPRINDLNIHDICNKLLDIILKKDCMNFENHKINDRQVTVFDSIIANNDVEFINEFCLNSLYRPEHSSNNLHYEIDSRFTCQMSFDDLQNSRLIPYIQQVARHINQTIHVGKCYINHYSLLTGVSKHSDSSNQNDITILVFCNKYWEETWGGELLFYDDVSTCHRAIEFKPRRIVMFDSRISHKVLPLTQSARKDRYTIAIKCTIDTGLEEFKKIYPSFMSVQQ